jgi:DNA-binding NarL/FixJ family response regulator
MNKTTRVLIVDDHVMVREGLAQIIASDPDLVLVGMAATGVEALELYRQHQPDVVTMDYKLPGQSGVECTAAICHEFPNARVILLSILEGDEDIWRATQAGAVGYVSKTVGITDVLAAIRLVAQGKPYFSAGLAEKIARRTPGNTLSAREFDVLREVVLGRSNKEIADKLRVSPTRVKRVIEQIFEKLNVADRTQATTVAIQRGIVHLDEL